MRVTEYTNIILFSFLKSEGVPLYLYDGYGVFGAQDCLNGNDQTDDDHMRFVITREAQGYYRIQTKATNRYIRLDEDQYVSSRINAADDLSLFQFVEA